MVVLKSLGFFVRASLARLHEVRVNPFAHTFREACDVARRFGWRRKIVGAGGRSSNDCLLWTYESTQISSTQMGVASTSRTLSARTTTHSLRHTDPCHILSDSCRRTVLRTHLRSCENVSHIPWLGEKSKQLAADGSSDQLDGPIRRLLVCTVESFVA